MSGLTIRRPVAVAMFFLGIVIVGVVGWARMPVELFPALQGDRLFVNFGRPGSEPEVVEREILIPLQAAVSALSNVSETRGEVMGSGGRFEIRFDPGVDIKIRELDMQRVVADLEREQPEGTWIRTSSADTSIMASFVMRVHVLGGDNEDVNALRDVVEELIAPRFAAVPGVSQVTATGGAPRQVSVVVDSERMTALGVTTADVTNTVRRNATQIRFLGEIEDGTGRTSVMLDGRPKGIHSFAEAQVGNTPVKLRHVGDVGFGNARKDNEFRVNGQPAVGVIIFQEQGANLVRLGQTLRDRVEALRAELRPVGLDLVVGFDGSEAVEDQIGHLGQLGFSGFLVALVVLYLFLREWRAVAVVAVAVPVSLLAALCLLFLLGLSLNLITLFGLALAIGLVVDNSVVVFEAVQRGLERGSSVDDAVKQGLGRTMRAIIAASATTAVVFLPLTLVDFDDALTAELVKVVTLAIVLPLVASLVVAVGLVPLLAHRLAGPAAVRRLAMARERRKRLANLVAPQPARIFFTGIVARALRHPPAWLAGTIVAVFVTAFVALPWVLVNTSGQEQESTSVEMSVRFPGRSIDVASNQLAEIEREIIDIEGVNRVEANVSEEGGSLVVQLEDQDKRPLDVDAAMIRRTAKTIAKKHGLEILRPGEDGLDGGKGGGGSGGGGGGPFGDSPLEVVLSGPESKPLESLARSVKAQLESMPPVANVWLAARPGMEEIWVRPNQRAFHSFGITFPEVIPMLGIAGREGERMQEGFLLENGRELPLVVERSGARNDENTSRDLMSMRVHTSVGAVPVMALADISRMPAPAMILHHNGRREISVFYRLDESVPSTGPGRVEIEDQIAASLRSMPRPAGYVVETASEEQATAWFSQVIIPVVLLLFLVMAMTFESLTLPVLVLVSLPLTLLGATWALALAGMPLGMMAMLGALALIGLTVNPSILLVDRMQQLVLGSRWSAGAAAFAAVRERTRPVLMTAATTIAGLWPLSLSTGQENEIWPPFATIVIGGLLTSTLLTLLIIPVGFILLRRLDDLFGRVGPWLVLAWLGATGVVMSSLIFTDLVTSLLWQVVLTLLVAGTLLAIVVLVFRKREIPEPMIDGGPPELRVRFLRKVYGLPGPLKRAVLAPRRFAEEVVARGATVFDASISRSNLYAHGLATAGLTYIALQLRTPFWVAVVMMIAATFVVRALGETRRLRGGVEATGVVSSGGFENVVAAFVPWLALAIFAAWMLVPRTDQDLPTAPVSVLTVLATVAVGLVQGARSSAKRQQAGTIPHEPRTGALRSLRSFWRRKARELAGFDLPAQPVTALQGVSFSVSRGMVGILGPNGAGKTTLLRQLAGILNPTRGTIQLGGVPYPKIQKYLARWVGYLPQDSGLPGSLTPREYLSYFAALYEIDTAERHQRVDDLLTEVGLGAKVDDPIGSLSGGMRQRVAVARTLLRLPPVIIVDEPTVGLDPRERIRFRNLLSRLARERIVLFSTHVVEDVAVACDRVLVFVRGQLRFDGDPHDLSRYAAGRVWRLRTPAQARLELPEGSIHAEESPMADGTVLHRILAVEAPRFEDAVAEEIDATLEDGYMWLVQESR